MEKQIAVLHYVLIVLCLGIAAGSIIASHELSQMMSDSDAVYAQTAPAGCGDRVMGRSGEQSKFENRDSKIETPDSDATPGPNRMHLVARHADGTIFYDHTVRYLRPNAGGKQPFIRLARTTAGMSNNLPAKMQAGDTLQVVWTLSF